MIEVEEILSLVQDTGVTLKIKKCAFFKTKVDYLGHNVLPGKFAEASAPTRAISETPFPTEKPRMRSFLWT